MLRYACALAATLIVAGCQSSPEREREKQATEIIERTITEVQTEQVNVDRYVPLPADLTKACKITYAENSTVGEIVRVANKNTLYLEECSSQIDKIRKLQPKGEK